MNTGSVERSTWGEIQERYWRCRKIEEKGGIDEFAGVTG